MEDLNEAVNWSFLRRIITVSQHIRQTICSKSQIFKHVYPNRIIIIFILLMNIIAVVSIYKLIFFFFQISFRNRMVSNPMSIIGHIHIGICFSAVCQWAFIGIHILFRFQRHIYFSLH